MIKANNILLIRTDRIGELLLTTPAMRAVRKYFPDARITAIVSPSSAEVLEGSALVDSIVEFGPKSDLGLIRRLKFLSFLKRSEFDMAIMFNASKFFNIMTFLAGIPVRVGYDRKAGFLLTHKIKDKKYLCEKHEIEYNLELIEAIGVRDGNKAPCFAVDNSAEKKLDRIFKEKDIDAKCPLIAVHPATSNPEKLWPPERFSQLSDRLIDELKAKIILVGGREEKKATDEIKSKMKNPVLDLTGELSLKELGALLKRCSFLVSSDSGPVHIAAALGTPVVVFFGEGRPGGSSRRWGPYGEGHIIIGKPKITDITVDETYKSISDKFAEICKRQ